MKIEKYDLYRLTGEMDTCTHIKTFFSNRAYRRIVYYRHFHDKSFIGIISRIGNRLISRKMSLELQPNAKIGEGMLFIHPYSITINSQAVVGRNLTMLKGATIGNSKTGRIGAPVIGDNVYIGLNSSIVGGVHIGNDVMIAPNTFVNFDVPDGCLVIGSPGIIHQKENASKEYIVNPIDLSIERNRNASS